MDENSDSWFSFPKRGPYARSLPSKTVPFLTVRVGIVSPRNLPKIFGDRPEKGEESSTRLKNQLSYVIFQSYQTIGRLNLSYIKQLSVFSQMLS